jgi:hypothetical protein
MSIKDKARLNRNLTRKPQNSTARDKQLLAAYTAIMQLKPLNSESDRTARRLISQEIDTITNRLRRKKADQLGSEIITSDLSNLERVARKEMARNKRLLN